MGGPAQRFTKFIGNLTKACRTNQDSPEPIPDASDMLQELAEQLAQNKQTRRDHWGRGTSMLQELAEQLPQKTKQTWRDHWGRGTSGTIGDGGPTGAHRRAGTQ